MVLLHRFFVPAVMCDVRSECGALIALRDAGTRFCMLAPLSTPPDQNRFADDVEDERKQQPRR